jgi:hypothetical protein
MPNSMPQTKGITSGNVKANLVVLLPLPPE